MGSTIMHPISSPILENKSSTSSRLVNSRVRVCFARSPGTPGDVGNPSVRAPDPALTNKESEWP